MWIDNFLKSMGLSYTTRHHMAERVRRTDWRFLGAVIALFGSLGAIIFVIA
ncbi:hypothetical protein [Sphingomonas parva]|uniref:hypothetical protein n=1 Tax=Sphingomonas parva TaxID=2555898 RepID=UPI00142F3E4F|nr:hypothetical protein [Sphingomonas parva]